MHAAADEEVGKISRGIHRATLPKTTQDTYRDAHNKYTARGVEHNKTAHNNHMTQTHDGRQPDPHPSRPRPTITRSRKHQPANLQGP